MLNRQLNKFRESRWRKASVYRIENSNAFGQRIHGRVVTVATSWGFIIYMVDVFRNVMDLDKVCIYRSEKLLKCGSQNGAHTDLQTTSLTLKIGGDNVFHLGFDIPKEF